MTQTQTNAVKEFKKMCRNTPKYVNVTINGDDAQSRHAPNK